MSHDPGGVVHHGVHGISCVDRSAEPAEGKGDHGEANRGEERVRPWQPADPVEQSLGALHSYSRRRVSETLTLTLPLLFPRTSAPFAHSR